MSYKYKKIIGITGTVFILAIGVFFIYRQAIKNRALPEHIQKNQNIGQEDSDFTVYDLNTRPVALSSFRGKVVMVNFWATWCAPCIEELPALNRLAGIYRKRLIILAVSNERTNDIKNFLMAFPVFNSNLIPANVGRRKMRARFSVRAFPETYILNKQGQLAQKITGPRKWDSEEWKSRIQKLIAE